MEIIENIKNPLLGREEITALFENNATPSKIEVAKMLSEHFKKTEESIIIEKIDVNFGMKNFQINAKIYDNPETKNKFETVLRKTRKKQAKETAEAEKIAAERSK